MKRERPAWPSWRSSFDPAMSKAVALAGAVVTLTGPDEAVPPRQDRCRGATGREALDCRHRGERRQHQGRRSVAKPSMRCAAASPGPTPVA